LRASSKQLEQSVDALNFVVNGEKKIWSKDSDGNLISKVGMFKLDNSDVGYQLTKIVNDGGGETDLSPRMKAGEMHKFLTGLFLGMDIQKKMQEESEVV
tara:strand:- start:1249 stop:1545 length:297 start_codon:yes stop_codon:yes gene_type:complete